MHTKLHIFQSGSQDLYGLTQDATGANLPAENGSVWRLLRTVEFEGGLPPWGLDVEWQEREAAVAAGISQNGYFLSERAALPSKLFDDSKA